MTCWLCGFETTELATNAKDATTCENVHCRICEEVANIDKEAVATLQRLLTKRCDLRSEQYRVHGTLIHRLPIELKNYIFELVVSGTSRNKWGEIPRMTRMTRNEGPRWTFLPSHLASVCRSWRDIAWSNPVLWSTMHINMTHASAFDLVREINFVQDWIQRSRTLPLTLHIVDHGVEGSEEGLKDVIDVVNQCSHRLHSLSLNIPFELLRTFQHNNFQLCPLKKLRLTAREGPQNDTNISVPLLDSTVSPEEVELCGIPFQSLQISWNQLTSATIKDFDLEEVRQLLRQASQMAHCRIFSLSDYRSSPSPMLPIIHQRLKTLGLCYGRHQDAARLFLNSLILPYLQEFHTTEMFPLKYLPALVHRSSCPLTRITFELTPRGRYREWGQFDGFQPLPGVTDLVVENVEGGPQVAEIKILLLEEYFPDLRHFILRLEPFRFFWDEGVIPELLVRERLLQGAAAEGRKRKILVIDQRRVHEINDLVWKSPIGTKLKELQVDVSLREDGFEILIPT